MKIPCISLLIVASAFCANAQLKIGANANTINTGSLLELESTSKAFLPPRMNAVQRNAIPTPVEGMTVYNTDSKCTNIFQNGAWYDPCAHLAAIGGRQKMNALLGGSASDICTAVEQTADGGFIMAGYTSSSASGDVTGANHGASDYWIVKLSAVGSIVWNKSLGGNNNDIAYDIAQTADGGYIVVGYSGSSASGDVTATSHGNEDCWVVKLDGGGNITWNRLLGGNGIEEGWSVQQTIDGGYIIAAKTTSSANGDVTGTNNGNNDVWIVKLNASGVITMSWLLGGSLSDSPNEIRQTPDGGYIVAGASLSSVSGTISATNHGGYDFWVVRIGASGSISWNKLLGGSSNDFPESITPTADGGYVVAGSSASSANGNVTGINHGGYDQWVVKLDGVGTIIWNKLLGGSGNDYAQSVIETTDGSYLVTGYAASSGNGDVTGISHGGNDYWMVKLSETGIKNWDRLWGGSGADEAHTAYQTADGGFVVGGRSTSSATGKVTSVNHGSTDCWLLKMNSLGAIMP